MEKTSKFKKTSGDFKLRLLGLALCGLMAGGVVVAGCGGGEEEAEDTPAASKEPTVEE
jgi:hypothetical protein